MRSIRTAALSLGSKSCLLLHLAVLLSFTHTIIAIALPADPPDTAASLALDCKPDSVSLSEPSLEGSTAHEDLANLDKVLLDMFPDDAIRPTLKFLWNCGRPLDQQDLWMALMLCTFKYLTENDPQGRLPPGTCYHPKFPKVAIRYKTVGPSEGLYLQMQVVVYSIVKGMTEMLDLWRFKMLRIEISIGDLFLGSVTLQPHTEPADVKATISEEGDSYHGTLEGVLVSPASSVAEDSPSNSVKGIVSIKDTCGAQNNSPSSLGATEYIYDTTFTGQTGLTLRPYALAVIYYLLILASERVGMNVVVDQMMSHPFRIRFPSDLINVKAGYKYDEEHTVPRRSTCPLFTIRTLVGALVELPALFLTSDNGTFEFFRCKIRAETAEGVFPLGWLWVEWERQPPRPPGSGSIASY